MELVVHIADGEASLADIGCSDDDDLELYAALETFPQIPAGRVHLPVAPGVPGRDLICDL